LRGPTASSLAVAKPPRLVQKYGLAEPAAEFDFGQLQDHPEGHSPHWREVMRIVQKIIARWSAATSCG
jgi:hypothetical protein